MTWLYKIIGAVVIIGGLYFYINYLHDKIDILESNQKMLEISNKSLIEENSRSLTFIQDTGKDLQQCIESKINITKQFEDINNKYNDIQQVPVNTQEVLPDEQRKQLRETLMRPLPEFK